MSMYVRVKHKRTTIFLHVEPNDTILEVKQKLQELTEQPPEAQILYKEGVPLEDAKKLVEYKIENDEALGVSFALPGGAGFEELDITPFPNK